MVLFEAEGSGSKYVSDNMISSSSYMFSLKNLDCNMYLSENNHSKILQHQIKNHQYIEETVII